MASVREAGNQARAGPLSHFNTQNIKIKDTNLYVILILIRSIVQAKLAEKCTKYKLLL